MSYKTYPIIPDKSELFNNSPENTLKRFLRQHSMPYNSAKEYLDRQFHLLREDCFYYLKKAVRTIKSQVDSPQTMISIGNNVWLHKNVKLFHVSFDYLNVFYKIEFQTNKKPTDNYYRELKSGSLLILSNDYFETIFLAKVLESTFKDCKYVAKIQFLDCPILQQSSVHKEFYMIEYRTNFESYEYALKRLQKIDENQFPFADYILFNKTLPREPLYQMKDLFHTFLNIPENLDEVQKSSFRSAVKKNISVIQGPPGTGKSTLGSFILKHLLETYLRTRVLKKPILVVSYTNNALDQFLERILQFCEYGEVIRMGSQSENEKVKTCSINVFVNEWQNQRKFPKHLSYEKFKIVEKLNSLKKYFTNPPETNETYFLQQAKTYETLLKQYEDIWKLEYQCILETSLVIGMTVSTCLKYADIIDYLGIEIMIVEEAAEILEAHLIGSISSKCQQLIMIGDHKQLTPSISVYEFGDVFDLNCSLFERLINLGFQYTSLTYQQRMRPDISRCILPIYPELKDSPNVLTYPNVKGVRTNIYFFNHTNPETEEFSYAFKNDFEIDFVTGMCSFLLSHGIDKKSITVLSTYSHQNILIRQKIKEIKSYTVDNYQGEENDIIILSLVRSNSLGKIGFLKKANRISVAFSRAKIGLFIVGNLNCLKGYPLWKDLSVILSSEIGSSLPVVCRRNENHNLFVSFPLDFSRKDFCGEICGKLNNCRRHYCLRLCHDGDHNTCETMVTKFCRRNKHSFQIFCHESVICKSIVYSKLSCGHSRPHLCDEDAPEKCEELVDIKLRCSHSQKMVCGTKPLNVICEKRWDQILECGHTYIDCIKYVGLCVRQIDFQMVCGHKITIKCFERKTQLKCLEKCLKKLNCGHSYPHLCNECGGGQFHKPCQEQVEHKCYCQHVNRILCSERYSEVKCLNKCLKKMKCGHSCKGICYQCNHGENHISCEEIIEFRLPCLHSVQIRCCDKTVSHKCQSVCKKMINCGHICHSICHDCDGGSNHKPCTEMVSIKLPCTHDKLVLCSLKNTKQICHELCKKKMICHHTCQSLCKDCDGGNNHLPCMEITPHYLPCDHRINIKCFEKNHPHKCYQACKKILVCGHTYDHKCHECQGGQFHKPCMEMILYPLSCQHNKNINCSKKNLKHICYEICSKKISCGHKCKNLCHECEGGNHHAPCEEIINKELICGHTKLVKCFQNDMYHKCELKCLKVLSCGHNCTHFCVNCLHGTRHMPCSTIINIRLFCKHCIRVKCSEKLAKHICQNICNKRLPCGHFCLYSCEDCINGRLHKSCKTKCCMLLNCGHQCKELCHSYKCKYCIAGCKTSVAKKIPEPLVKDWIILKDSLSTNVPFSIKITLNEIVTYILSSKCKFYEIKKFYASHQYYEKLFEIYKSLIEPINEDRFSYYKDHILYSFSRIVDWMSPLLNNVLKENKVELKMEFERVKDMANLCLLCDKEENEENKKYYKLLKELSEVQYDEETKLRFKETIIQN